MKKLLLLTKTLLAAVLLCVGQNAWADDYYNATRFSQDYETEATITNGWTLGSNVVAQQSLINGSNNLYLNVNKNKIQRDNTLDLSGISSYFSSAEEYQFSFEYGYSHGNANAYSNGLILYAPENVVLFKITQPGNYGSTNTIYDKNETSLATFTSVYNQSAKGVFLTFTVTGSKSANNVKLTVLDGSSTIVNNVTISSSFLTIDKLYLQMTGGASHYFFDNLLLKEHSEDEVVSNPSIADPVYAGANRTVTVTAGTSSKGNSVTTYYTTDGTAPSSSNYAGSFTTATKDVTITSNCTLKAITISSTSEQSFIVEKAITVGKLTLNAPVVSSIIGFTKSGDTYYPQYTFSSDQSSVMGNPDVTYSYTIAGDPNATPNPSGYSEAKAGELIVTVSAEGYNSASAEVITVLPYSLTKSYDFSKEYTLNSNWSKNSDDASMPNGEYAISGKRYTPTAAAIETGTNVSGTLFEGLAFSQNRANYYYFVQGLGIGQVGGDKVNNTTITIAGLTENDYTVYRKYNSGNTQTDVIVAGNSTWNLGKMSGTGAHVLHGIFVYSPDPVAIAIADCKKYETSSDFATAVEAESFSTAAEVYAFHTAWQIAKADAASSNDITKVIFDAAVSDFSRWNNARSSSGQQYTGAPDNKYFDAWNNDPSDGKQKIYGLPAGTYTLKVATRASADVTDKSKYNVWVSGGSAGASVLGNHIGNTGGCLGNGWNWTILSFTLDAKADVEIGFYSCPPADRWAGADDWHLYKGSLSETATISSYGWATFSSDYPLDFTGISDFEAYMITGYEGNVVTKSKVEGTVPAGTGLLLKGDEDSYNIPVVASSSTDVSANKLVAGTGASVSYEAGKTKYVLGVSGSEEAEFQKIVDGGSAATVAKGKAYLQFNEEILARSMRFSGDITGVENVEAAPTEAKAKDGKFIENGKLVIVKNGVKYNAAGAQVK